MLSVLCGNKTTQKILLFLLVNGRCYGTQLHRMLKMSLTPIQKSLSRLEKGGIVLSDFEGKTRLYQFNPAYPLLAELEHLLKKAYILLPMQEQKLYSLQKDEKQHRALSLAESREILRKVWNRLMKVTHLKFHAKTKLKEEGGWNGKGKGEVIIKHEKESVLVFHEKGSWQGREYEEVNFTNVFRWTLDLDTLMLSLEHLRRGLQHPVFLFHLSPTSHNVLTSVDSHSCGEDVYFGRIVYDHQCLRLNWRVIGPKKNEEIDYYYTTS